MGTEAEAAEQRSIPQLPIFSLPLPPPRSLEQPGVAPSPLHTAASVPFRWEEQPGKPRPCPATTANAKCLELPPRLQNSEAKSNKTPSPTTVLEGPYYSHLSRSIFQSQSFRFARGKTRQHDLSLDGGSGGSSPDRGLLGESTTIGSRGVSRDRGLFGSLRRRGSSFGSSREVSGGSFVFSGEEGYGDGGSGGSDGFGWTEMTEVKMKSVRRKRSLFGIAETRSTIWATICGALKQVIPRQSNRWKKQGN